MSLHLTKLWSYVKDEDLQQMAFALELFGLRLLTTWAWWFSPGNSSRKLNPGGSSGSGLEGEQQHFKHCLALLAGRRVV